jgi:hypothetical protein
MVESCSEWEGWWLCCDVYDEAKVETESLAF